MNKITLNTEYLYKGYKVKIYDQEPDIAWIKYEESGNDDLMPENGRGYSGYEILDSKENIIESDFLTMGDDGAAKDNAENEIDWIIREREENE